MDINDFKKKDLRKQFGLDATVQRETLGGEAAGVANRKLNEIGAECNPNAEHLEYVGSAAFHVYLNRTLGQVFFVNQTGPTLKDCPRSLVQYALKDFTGGLMEKFGDKRPLWRSGF